jgi:hypothetical protein
MYQKVLTSAWQVTGVRWLGSNISSNLSSMVLHWRNLTTLVFVRTINCNNQDLSIRETHYDYEILMLKFLLKYFLTNNKLSKKKKIKKYFIFILPCHEEPIHPILHHCFKLTKQKSDVVGPSPVHITLCNKKGKEEISRLFNLIIQGLNKKKKKKNQCYSWNAFSSYS